MSPLMAPSSSLCSSTGGHSTPRTFAGAMACRIHSSNVRSSLCRAGPDSHSSRVSDTPSTTSRKRTSGSGPSEKTGNEPSTAESPRRHYPATERLLISSQIEGTQATLLRSADLRGGERDGARCRRRGNRQLPANHHAIRRRWRFQTPGSRHHRLPQPDNPSPPARHPSRAARPRPPDPSPPRPACQPA